MKRLLLILTLISTVRLSAQVLCIHKGSTVLTVPTEEAGEMTYSSGGSLLTIAGITYSTQEIDSITFTDTSQPDSTVLVNYSDKQTQIFIPADLASLISCGTDGAHVTITSAQTGGAEITYRLQGTATDGSLTLDGGYKCIVELAGLSLTSQRGAAIDIQNGKRIDIVMAEGSVNQLSDCENGSQKACLYVKGHPELKGGGTLILQGNTRHAFASNEYTWIKKSAGRIEVNKAVSDAFHCEQYFRMEGGDLILSGMNGDGIQVEYTKDPTDEQNGQLMIENGLLQINLAGNDVKGIRADSIMTISGGNLYIRVTGDGSKGISADHNLYINENTAPLNLQIETSGGIYINPDDPTDDSKCMGINCKRDLRISAGTLNITSTGEKSKSIKVDGVYYGPGNAVLNLSPAMDY